MSEESTSVLEVAGENGGQVAPDARLKLLLRRLLIGLGVLVAIFSVVYYLGQKSDVVEVTPLLEQSVIDAEATVREQPNNLDARLQLADAYARNSQRDEAIAQLDEILRVEPEHRAALLGKGMLLYQAGDNTTAKSVLQHFVRTQGTTEFASQDTQLGYAYYTLGLISASESDYKDSAGYLTKSINVDNSNADAWYSLGVAFNEINNPTDAVSAFLNATAFVPVGWCEPYQGLKRSYELLNDEGGITYATAIMNVCAGDGMDAAAPVQALAKSGRFVVESYFTLGLGAENDEDLETAAKWYQKALDVDPTYIIANQRLKSLGVTDVGHP